MQISKSLRLSVLAIGEWLIVLPAVVFLVAAALRNLQPPQFEPARASWAIFDWTTTHISHLGAAALFIGIPGLVLLAGCAALVRSWQQDQALRDDAILGIAILRRNLVIGLLMTATLLAAAVFTLAVAHLVTD